MFLRSVLKKAKAGDHLMMKPFCLDERGLFHHGSAHIHMAPRVRVKKQKKNIKVTFTVTRSGYRMLMGVFTLTFSPPPSS